MTILSKEAFNQVLDLRHSIPNKLHSSSRCAAWRFFVAFDFPFNYTAGVNS
jgi:hypothetical protein